MNPSTRDRARPPTALTFLTLRLLDRQAGGCFGATDVTGAFPLSADKQLTDQSSAVLALVEGDDDDALDISLAGLRNMHDTLGQPGFVESTDRYWQPHPAGRVRSLRFQLHAAAALLAGAHRRDDDELRARAVDLLNRCLSLADDGVFPTQVTEDWRDVLDGTESPQTAVSAVRALAVAHAIGENGVDGSGLPAIARMLSSLVERVSWPGPARDLTRCSSLARVAISLAHAGRMLGAEEYLKAAHTVLGLADQFYDPEDQGFWDRLDADGRARVDWVRAPGLGRAPFPVKRAADAAQLLLAGRLLRSCQLDIPGLVDRAEAAIAGLVDQRHGGVYLGMGYQWPTPTDPGTRSMQQVWARPAQPGLTVGGALGNLALAQKSAHTQATVARALPGGVRLARPEAARSEVMILPPVTARDWPPRVEHSVDLGVDRLGYLRMLLGTRASGSVEAAGAGRSSGHDRSPDPARSGPDPTADPHQPLSLMYHTVVGIRLLSGLAPVPPTVTRRILFARGDDGGFGEQTGQLSDVASTWRATVALYLAGTALPDPGATAGYLRGCQNADGGFGAVPGMVSDLAHTAFALAALRLIGSDAAQPAEAGAFVSSWRQDCGGYGDRPGRPADGFAVRHAVAAHLLLGLPVPGSKEVVGWLHTTGSPCGGFSHRPGRAVSVMGTHHAVAALSMVDSVTHGLDACTRWLKAQRGHDGASGSLSGTTGVGDDGFAYLQSVAILRGAVSRSWLAVVV